MKFKFFINGQKVTRAAVKNLVGEKRFEEIISEAKETMKEDPLIECDFWLGGTGMLTVEADPWA